MRKHRHFSVIRPKMCVDVPNVLAEKPPGQHDRFSKVGEVKDWRSTENNCSFEINGMAKINIDIIDKQPFRSVTYKATANVGANTASAARDLVFTFNGACAQADPTSLAFRGSKVVLAAMLTTFLLVSVLLMVAKVLRPERPASARARL